MAQTVVCACCRGEFVKITKRINQVVKNSGAWRCKPCATKAENKARAKPIGSLRKTSAGYIEVKTAHGWQRQHRAVAEAMLGRALMADEAVHHVNEDKEDNRPCNLTVVEHGQHTAHHHTGARRSAVAIENMRLSLRKKAGVKLSPEAALAVREAVGQGMAQRQVAQQFGVSPMAISRAVRGKSWGHISG